MRTLIIEIDGNDGVGKTYTIERLKEELPELEKECNCHIVFKDRGALSQATITGQFQKESDHVYIILDASIEYCQKNIVKRGDSLDEPYHNVNDLVYYRQKFHELSVKHKIPTVIKGSFIEDSSVLSIIKSIIKDYATTNS